MTLWDVIKTEIIDKMICSKEFIEQVKEYKEHFIQYNLDGKECSKIRSMLKELQGGESKRN